MKKTTSLLVGLFIGSLTLTGCINKNDYKEPKRGEFTYDIEFSKYYVGRDKVKCYENLRDKLASEKIKSLKFNSLFEYRLNQFKSTSQSIESEAVFYKNSVCITDENVNSTYYQYDSKLTEKSSIRFEFLIDNGMLLSNQVEMYPDGDYSVSSDATKWGDEDISNCAYLFDFYSSGGEFGFDQDKNGIYYHITSSVDDSYTAYLPNGQVTDGIELSVDEFVVKYDGDPINGRPITMFYDSRVYKYFDDNNVVIDEPIITHRTFEKIDILYGKRKQYKNKDELIKNISKETLSDSIDVNLNVYTGGVINETTKNMDVMPTLVGEVETDIYSDGYIDNEIKQTGVVTTESMSRVKFEKDHLYRLEFEGDTKLFKNTETDGWVVNGNTYFANADLNCNCPNGLVEIISSSEGEFIYVKETFTAQLVADYTFRVFDDNGVMVPVVNADITFNI